MRISKFLSIVLAANMFFAAGTVSAQDSGIASDSAAEADATATINNNTVDNSRTLPQVLTPMKQDGSFVSPPQLYYHPRLNIPDEALPDIYRIEGWKILFSAPYDNGVPIKRVKTERKSWISDEESVTGESVDQNARATEDSDMLTPLPYYPEGTKEVAIAKVFLQDEKYIINQAVAEALYHAWRKSGSAHFLILYNTRLVSEAKVRALGSAIVGGVSVDPQSANNTSVNALSGGGGVGWGTARAHVFEEPTFMIIAFSNKGEIPQRLLKKEEPKEEPTAKQEEVREEPKIIVKEEVVFPVVEFGFDKFKLVTQEQKKPIRAAAKKTAENWDKMKKENMYVMVVGSCSPEGSVEYNDVLGRKRAQEVYNLFTTILTDVYGLPAEEVKERVKYVSAGENNPELNGITRQRNAVFFVVAKVVVPKKE